MKPAPMHHDIAIIGQGLAGSLMGYFLAKLGWNILVIDDHHNGASSIVAAGIVNPITGKSFVRSWNIGEFLPFALQTYRQMERELNIDILREAHIIRSLYSVEDENAWYARSADPVVGQYICPQADVTEFNGKVHPPFAYGETRGTFHVRVPFLLSALKERWTGTGCYLEGKLDYDELGTSSPFFYNGHTFDRIIFCEGHQATGNPFFPGLGMGPSKGEVLMVKIPEAHFRKMYKDHIFIVHSHDDTYWVGGGYQWNSPDDKPSLSARQNLETHLRNILAIPYEVVEHKAAIRPTMHSRRPVFLQNKEHQGMYLFNGLGTKGTSIGPLAAHQIASYLADTAVFPPLFGSIGG